MSKGKRAVIPDGTPSPSDDDFASSTERVRAVRRKAIDDASFAVVVDAKRAAIDRRLMMGDA